MANCEQCGTSFDLSKAATEVTSTRILCPKCAEERRVKLARLRTGTQAPSAPGSAAAASAPSAASRPTPAPARVAPVEASRASARKADKKPAVPAERPSHEAHHYREQSEGQMMKIVWVVAALFVIGAGGFAFKVVQDRKAEEAALVEAAAADLELYEGFRAFNVQDEAGARQLIDKFNTSTEALKGSRYRDKVQALVGQATETLRRATDAKYNLEELEKIERDLVSIGSLTGERLAEMARMIEELEDRASSMTRYPDYATRVQTANDKIASQYLIALVQDARRLAEAGPESWRAALAKYARAEDEIQDAYGDASKAGKGTAITDPLKKLFQEVVGESDALCAKTFTQAVIDATPWKDLLGPDQEKNWNPSPTAGFTCRASGGVLELSFQKVDAKSGTPIASIGDREKWRDFVLEIEIEFLSDGVKDEPKLYLRSPVTNLNEQSTFNRNLEVDSASLQEKQKYLVTISAIGSQVKFGVEPEDVEAYETEVPMSRSRKGGVAFVVPDGCQMRVTKMRIRELRATAQGG